MHIDIAERLRPYSHTAGISCLLPGSFYQLKIYPTLIQVYTLYHSEPVLKTQLQLDLKGPIKEFTVEQDLEKGCIHVWGHTPEGYVRYQLTSEKDGTGIQFSVEKASKNRLIISDEHHTHILKVKEPFYLYSNNEIFTTYLAPSTERLSLGNHKSQEWDQVQRRVDMIEILPVWNRLSQLMPLVPVPLQMEGTLLLVEKLKEIVSKGKPEEIVPAFQNLFRAGFYGLFTPRLQDDQYQGLIPDTKILHTHTTPLYLLTEVGHVIRNLFIRQENDEILVLPQLPPEFHAGRFLHVKMKEGLVHLEWTKKFMRRFVFHSEENQTLKFKFKNVQKYRLRVSPQDRGNIITNNQSIFLEKNGYYLFDNFS